MTTLAKSASRRLTCPVCERPSSACICQWIRPVVHTVEVLVLQHPLEVAHPKGSARLLHLSLPGSRLVVGETFAPALLDSLLTSPFTLPTAGEIASPRQALLLYPDGAASLAGSRGDDCSASLSMDLPMLPSPAQLRLVVLDGTWRKSRKMLHCNPQLAQLPRLSLHNLPRSRYRIRKAHRPDQLSTLEAVCAALVQLEGGCTNRFDGLMEAFDGFVALQVERMRLGGIGRQTQTRLR